MRHLIQKQEFLLTVLPGVDAFRVQHAASRYLREQLLPLLERIFDELSTEQEVISLDHCIIDLGNISMSVLETGVADEATYRSMKEEIGRMIEKELALHPAARRGIRESALATWWYYMEHGRLPWNAEQLTEEDLRAVLELLSVDYAAISRLRKTLVEQPLFLMRVVAQHREGFLENLLATMTSSRQEGLAEAIAQVLVLHRVLEKKYGQLLLGAAGAGPAPAASAPTYSAETEQGLRWWASRMSALLEAPAHEKKAVLWRRILFEAAERPASFAAMGGMAILLKDIPSDRGLANELLADGEVAGVGEPLSLQLRRRQAAAPRTPESGSSGEISPPGESAPAEQPLREDEVRFKREAVDEEGIYLPNAGLILVHPFLSTLFHRVGFWDGAGFVDVVARQRAVLLLHYVATGDRHPPEHALVLPKLLCGYALEMPMPGELELTADECGEAVSLLENVVQRWEKLGSSSIEGLREGFLQRPGKLFDKGGRLYLQLESSGVDVLLDYLPWGLSIVKMPWLAEPIYVEWR
jgi:Contractile injection system tape measure protein